MTAHPNPHHELVYDGAGSLCSFCIDGVLRHGGIPNTYQTSGGGLRWTWETKPPEETLVAFQAYLDAPGCTPERHAWWEALKRAEAEAAFLAAKAVINKARALEPGWSL